MPHQRAERAPRAGDGEAELAGVNLVGERIGDVEARDERFGKRLNGADLHGEARIVDETGEGARLIEKMAGPAIEVANGGAQRSAARAVSRKHVDARAMRGERVRRQIDAVEIAIVLRAILKVIDDLQRRAERVIGRPDSSGLLAMHVADEAADRHGRIAAVIDEIVPVAIAQLVTSRMKAVMQVARMLRIELPRAAFLAQARGDRLLGPRSISAGSSAPADRASVAPRASDGRRYRRPRARNRKRP